jgi:hypothetical protein
VSKKLKGIGPPTPLDPPLDMIFYIYLAHQGIMFFRKSSGRVIFYYYSKKKTKIAFDLEVSIIDPT